MWTDIKAVYNNNAQAFDQQRSKSLFEKKWLDRLIAKVPLGSTILDVGCGSGDPIASYLMDRGMLLTGIDFAPNMLALARQRFPDAEWIEQDLLSLSLECRFDALVVWNSFFHLRPEVQEEGFRALDKHLQHQGWLLMTVGDRHGEVCGWVNGQEVYHASLSPQAYRKLLSDYGYRLEAFVLRDRECNQHTILFAQKI